jgi:trehalose/maltose hydrolase-like predicted phosphorylase
MHTHLANGHIGLQYTDSGLAPARSFMLGVCDVTANDVYRMALLPTWNAVDLEIGSDSLSTAFERGEVRQYRQSLDTGTACLRTHYGIRISGVWVSVDVETWLSRGDRFLGYQTVEVSADTTSRVSMTAGIFQNSEPKRYPWRSIVWPHEDFPREYGLGFTDKRMSHAWHPGHMTVAKVESRDAVMAVAAEAGGFGPSVGIAMALRFNDGVPIDKSDSNNARTFVEMSLTPGKKWRLEQFVAFSRDDCAGTLVSLAAQRAARARDCGREPLWDAHMAEWNELWKSDIAVEGNDTLARQARADLFYLYQNAPVDERYPYQIMGISSPGYWGGCFWDADLFANPGVLPFHNHLARPTANFRKRVLAFALRNAQSSGQSGAKYPWIACVSDGEENCVNREHAANEIHIGADVVIGMWLYFCATGDYHFLRNDLLPVARAVADYYLSRAVWIPWENRYEIQRVTCADEKIGIVDNCLYTNASAKRAIQIAIRAARLAGQSPSPLWEALEHDLHIPLNRTTGLWQAHSGTAKPSPDRFLETNAIIFAGLPANPGQLASTIDAPPIPWDMSCQAIVAAQAGDAEKLSCYLNYQATNFVHSDFLVRTEQRGNDAGPYLSGCGALLQNLLLGCGGMRWSESGLEPMFPSVLPSDITRIAFSRLEWHGLRYSIEISRTGRTIEQLKD